MYLQLNRCKMAASKPYTIGHLWIDGQYICDTIEDRDRGLTQSMSLADINRIKVKAQTAIPRGRYEVTLNVTSPKFSLKPYYWQFCRGKVPRLLNVPGFEGILMHRGVNQNSSAGCIILGYNTIVGQVTNSQVAFEKVYHILQAAKEPIYIHIQ